MRWLVVCGWFRERCRRAALSPSRGATNHQPPTTNHGLALALLGPSWQSALNPAGPYAASIAKLWWLFLTICAVVWILVTVMLLAAIWKGRHRLEPDATEASTRSSAKIVGGALGVTVVLLFFMLVASVATGRAISPSAQPATRDIEVIGHQWWWEIHYQDPLVSRIVVTANELHLPAGETVMLHLSSRDVIHSAWIPNLHGKRDLIPGHDASFPIRADRTGVFRGQCAEFCGYQHAKMGLIVVVEPKQDFDKYLEGMRTTSPPPANLAAQKGQQVFMTATCAMCHTIAGTDAGAKTGPDLSHLGSRRTLGAGAIPNTRGNLAGWIVNAGSVKPGVLMPPNNLTPEELNSLVVYLETLK